MQVSRELGNFFIKESVVALHHSCFVRLYPRTIYWLDAIWSSSRSYTRVPRLTKWDSSWALAMLLYLNLMVFEYRTSMS